MKILLRPSHKPVKLQTNVFLSQYRVQALMTSIEIIHKAYTIYDPTLEEWLWIE